MEIIKDTENYEVGLTYHNGVNYIHVRSKHLDNAVCCVGKERFTLRGYPKITMTYGSYRFGQEIQFSLTNKKGVVVAVPRNSTTWDTMEINLPFPLGVEVLAEALVLAKNHQKQSSIGNEGVS